jgi:hypothetical protein
MTDSPVVERQEEFPAPPASAPVSPGVGRLLHGKKEEEIPAAPELEQLPSALTEGPATGFIRGILILADFLLIAMACVLALKSTAPFGFVEMTLCSVALVLGGVLSCVAILWKR